MSHQSVTTPCWHVTSKEAARDILAQGFLGGWGDAGFGVYMFDNFGMAELYAQSGGWDGALKTPVILEIQVPREDLQPVIPDPGWPNPEDYEHVIWVAKDPDDQEGFWYPKISYA